MKKVGGLKLLGFNIIASIIIIGVIWLASNFCFKSGTNTANSVNQQNNTASVVASWPSPSPSGSKTNSYGNGGTATCKYYSPLNITLSGDYYTAYLNAVKGLGDSETDNYKKLIAKIGLQILQSKTIVYSYDYHYYSLSYSASANIANKNYYNLKSAINCINSGKKFYTDCFGFVRLTYSIACYAVNSSAPQNVQKLNALYGYAGGYQNTSKITSIGNLTCGAMLADRLTGAIGGTSDRHVAIFLYRNGNTCYYMDQDGLFASNFVFTGNYIYSAVYSKPYKFNCFKNFI